MYPDQHEILRALGERIAELRRRSGLTQDQVSELSEIDIQAVQRAETGRGALSLERLARLARTLGVELADLFSFAVPSTSTPGWSAEEGRVVAAYRSVPEDRRELVLPLIGVLARR